MHGYLNTSYAPKVAYPKLLATAERRSTPVLLSASVSDNSGNSPQVAAPMRPCAIDMIIKPSLF